MALLRQVEIEHGSFEVGMAHVPLNGAEVDAGFEQMGGIAMATRIVTLLIMRRWPRFVTRTIPSADKRWRLSDGYGARPRRVSSSSFLMASQGHLVFGHGVAQQVYNELQGFVPRGALLSRHTSHEPKPFPQVDHHDSTAAAPHRGLRRDSRLSPPSGQTPSLARYTLAGLLCDVVWLSQL